MRTKLPMVSVTLACLALAACTSAQNAQKQSSGATTSKGGGTRTIGLVTFSGTDPSANIVVSSAKKKAQEAGYKVVVVDAQGQVDQANTAMQNLVQRKVAGIAITVFPVSSLAAGLASTKQAGIPVVTSGGGTGDGIAVNVDDSQGETVTQALVDGAKGEGDVLTLTYLGGRPCQLRLASFNKTVKSKAPALKVTRQAITVPGQIESATSATLAWLAAHPIGSAPSLSIYACFDDPALGAIAALKQTNRTDVKVYSFNGIAPALAAVKNGTMTATLWFDQSAVGSTLVDVLDKSIKSGAPTTSKQVPAPSVLVTKDNYSSFVTKHPGAIKAG